VDDRRVQRLELTAEGVAMFDRLRSVAVHHDAQLRASFSAEELVQLTELLDRLRATVEASTSARQLSPRAIH
jgi:DNA-binding MarR family transcriptional regulator